MCKHFTLYSISESTVDKYITMYTTLYTLSNLINYHLLVLQVLGNDSVTEVGKISKQWSGLAKEYFTDADNFGIQCKWHHQNQAAISH